MIHGFDVAMVLWAKPFQTVLCFHEPEVRHAWRSLWCCCARDVQTGGHVMKPSHEASDEPSPIRTSHILPISFPYIAHGITMALPMALPIYSPIHQDPLGPWGPRSRTSSVGSSSEWRPRATPKLGVRSRRGETYGGIVRCWNSVVFTQSRGTNKSPEMGCLFSWYAVKPSNKKKNRRFIMIGFTTFTSSFGVLWMSRVDDTCPG